MSTIQDNPLFMALAAAVLHPALRTILIYDAPYDGLSHVAAYLNGLLQSLKQECIITQLGSTEYDDDLWGYIPLPTGDVLSGETDSHPGIQLRPLLFAEKQTGEHVDLLVLPDLAGISLAVARAGIMLAGERVAHLERNEHSETWLPQHYWLAACAQDNIGKVSPHLVERFALRLRWQDALLAAHSHTLHVQRLQQQLTEPEHPSGLSAIDRSHIQELATWIRQAQHYHPSMTAEATNAILDYFRTDLPATRLYHRHEITLARYATVIAQLAGISTVDEQHIEKAAALMGLKRSNSGRNDDNGDNTTYKENETRQSPVTRTSALPEKSAATLTSPGSGDETSRQEHTQKIIAETSTKTLAPLFQHILAPEQPYLEDSAPILREEASLRLPMPHSTLSRGDHGSIVGVEKGPSLRDIAIVSTILHAALFSKQRQAAQQSTDWPAGIQITRDDLYHYRRAPAPTHMLLLLLDYTSIKHCNWSDALLPHLHKAYTQRASISIVKVGAKDARHELQAEVFNARSILVPGVDRVLETSAGKATPLAHGLQLVQQTLQRNLQHGRNTVQHVTLVVISDGRGNIPLQASINNRMTTLVTREGIGDALKIAQEISTMKHVESVLLNPQPTHCTHLPQLLAEALRATIEFIPPFTADMEGLQ